MAPPLLEGCSGRDSAWASLPPVILQMHRHHSDHRRKVRRSISTPVLPPIVSSTLSSETSKPGQESCSTSQQSTQRAAMWLDNQTKGLSKNKFLGFGRCWHGREAAEKQGTHESSGRSAALLAHNVDWADMQVALEQRRRALRKDFQGREGCSSTTTEVKRRLVPGLVAMEDSPQHLAKERNRSDNRKLRIRKAIRSCSNSRLEVVDLQRTMAALAVHEDVKNGLKEKARALAEVQDEM